MLRNDVADAGAARTCPQQPANDAFDGTKDNQRGDIGTPKKKVRSAGMVYGLEDQPETRRGNECLLNSKRREEERKRRRRSMLAMKSSGDAYLRTTLARLKLLLC